MKDPEVQRDQMLSIHIDHRENGEARIASLREQGCELILRETS